MFLQRFSIWVLPLMVFLLVFVAGETWISQKEEDDRERIRRAAEQEARHTTLRIERHLNETFSTLHALSSIVRQNGGVPADFDKIAAALLEQHSSNQALALAPSAVVSHVYPLLGNEKAIGHNLLADPLRRDEILMAINTRQIVLSGPYPIVQGGIGSFARMAVFLRDSAGVEQFWGIVSSIIRMPELLARIRLDILESAGYEFELWHMNGPDKQKFIIAKSSGMLADSPLETPVSIPNGQWMLSISPKAGWQTGITYRFERLLLFLLALISGLIVLRSTLREKKLARSEAELQIRNVFLESQNETAYVIMNQQDIRELLNEIVARASMLCRAERAFLYMISDDGRNMELRVVSGTYVRGPGFKQVKGEGMVGRIWDSGEPLWIGDYQTWPARLHGPGFDTMKACAGVPLKISGQVVGVLGVNYMVGDQDISQKDVDHLAHFGELVSLALQNTKLREDLATELKQKQFAEEQVRRMNIELEKRVAERTKQLQLRTEVMDQLRQTAIDILRHKRQDELYQTLAVRAVLVAQAEGAAFYFEDRNEQCWELRYGVGDVQRCEGTRVPYGKHFVGLVSAEKKVLFDNAYHQWTGRMHGPVWDNIRSIIGVPLIVDGQVTAVLIAHRTSGDHPFGQEEVEAFSQFAALASVALYNMNIYTCLDAELSSSWKDQPVFIAEQVISCQDDRENIDGGKMELRLIPGPENMPPFFFSHWWEPDASALHLITAEVVGSRAEIEKVSGFLTGWFRQCFRSTENEHRGLVRLNADFRRKFSGRVLLNLLYVRWQVNSGRMAIVSAGVNQLNVATTERQGALRLLGNRVGQVEEPFFESLTMPVQTGDTILAGMGSLRGQNEFLTMDPSDFPNAIAAMQSLHVKDLSTRFGWGLRLLQGNDAIQRFSFTGQIAYRSIRHRIREWVIRRSGERGSLFAVAVNEAASNALRFGAVATGDPTVNLILRQIGTRYLVVRISDHGPGFDVERGLQKIRAMEKNDFQGEPKETGRGLYIMQSAVDRLQFNKKGNDVLMIIKIGTVQ